MPSCKLALSSLTTGYQLDRTPPDPRVGRKSFQLHPSLRYAKDLLSRGQTRQPRVQNAEQTRMHGPDRALVIVLVGMYGTDVGMGRPVVSREIGGKPQTTWYRVQRSSPTWLWLPCT